MFHFFKKKYIPLNTIEISKSNLLHNYKVLSNISTSKIAPVLKSNAYGHGIVQIAKILDGVGAPFFCVDSIYEGYQLLKAKIKTPILIMGYIPPENLQVKKLPFSYAVSTEDMLYAVKKYQPHASIHVFVDTGMHREGVPINQLASFIRKAQSLNLKITGLMSHFAMAEKVKDPRTQSQIDQFTQAKKIAIAKHVNPEYVHIFASTGILHAKEFPLNFSPIARVGLALYGIDPEQKNKTLLPALSLISTIAQIKYVKKGEKIGYDFTYRAKKDMRIAVLPIGYNDGINRKLSNKGYGKIKNTFCPLIGRVSMNITLIDISAISKASVGDKIVIYSQYLEDRNNILAVAKQCNILAYELLVGLHTSTKRIIV